MSEIWIGAVAGLVGVLLGSGIGLIGSLIQRRWQLQDRKEEESQTRASEVRARMDIKAQLLLEHLAAIETILMRHIVISRDTLWADASSKTEARRVVSAIAVESGFLTQPLRRHVRVVVDLLPDAERLAAERWVDATARSVAYSALRWARRNLERYVRGESVPNDRGEPINTYVEGWNDLQDFIENQIADSNGPTAS